MAAGDHIKVKRGLGVYCHHGIDMGDGTVIHFSGEPFRRREARVCRVPVDEFLRGGDMCVESYGVDADVLPVEETLRLAEEQLDQTNYDVLLNNCEHFASYCKTGRKKSRQVRFFVNVAVGATALGLAVVTHAVRNRLGKSSSLRRNV